ncbi:MAG TPA: hypothetical protein VGA38_00200 [Candidatus Limnocylindria bacterium]
MKNTTVATLIALALLLAACTKTNPDQKPVYFDIEVAGTPA